MSLGSSSSRAGAESTALRRAGALVEADVDDLELVDLGAGLEDSCASDRLGAVFSTAQASRWRMVGKWASQHDTVQKNVGMRLPLHVETLHTQYVALYAIGSLQLLHLRHV